MGGDGEYRGLGFVDIGRVRIPHAVVEVDEESERSPRGALVAIREWMVPGETAGEDGGFVGEVG